MKTFSLSVLYIIIALLAAMGIVIVFKANGFWQDMAGLVFLAVAGSLSLIGICIIETK